MLSFLKRAVIGYQFMRVITEVNNMMRAGSEDQYSAALDKYRSFVVRKKLNMNELKLCSVIWRQMLGLEMLKQLNVGDEIKIDFSKVRKIPFQFLGNVGFKNYRLFRNKAVVFQYSNESDDVQVHIDRQYTN